MTDDRFNRAVYVISVAAELAGVHPQTLRIYERKGLLAPARTAGGSRRYSDADLALLERIAELTDEGLNLAGVQRVLELEQTVARLKAQLDETLRAHERHLDELTARGFNPGGLVPAVPRSRAVTLYRATRAPASIVERVSDADPVRNG
ncbi:MAG: helix-turn-helix transcriptional regulator [Acidimicrobiaceae bacterium]|nr:helix-turn-helix transcriptional regulator [Acidimicrobiaceae bacterium]